MPTYSASSRRLLATTKQRLQDLFNEVIAFIDIKILNGKRTRAEQVVLLARGLTKTMDSKHLTGDAVDAAPYPERWDAPPIQPPLSAYDADMIYLGGFVVGFAAARGVKIRYGGDWNQDARQVASGFRDLDHFELAE